MSKFFDKLNLGIRLWKLGNAIFRCIKNKKTGSHTIDYQSVLESADTIIDVLDDPDNVNTAVEFATELKSVSRKLRDKI